MVLLLALLYSLLLLWLFSHWQRLPQLGKRSPKASASDLLSVLIPCRNEAANIEKLLSDLQQQTHRQFEVIVIDDHSTDATWATVNGYQAQANFPLKLLKLTNGQKGKKAAIQQAIQQAKGSIIVTTDGDCSVEKDWLGSIAETFSQQPETQLLVGPVSFHPTPSVFGQLQTVEFLSLIVTGAATIGAGAPTMSNGANLAYRKSAFETVQGFSGNEQHPSGDDEFLMHKIAKAFPKGIRFLKNPQAIVRTAAVPSLKQFWQQRKRWGSKAKHQHHAPSKLLAVSIFLVHFSFCLSVILWTMGLLQTPSFLVGWGLKLLAELLFFGSTIRFFGKVTLLKWVPLLTLLHPWYLVTAGLAANFGGFEWKGRKWLEQD